MILFEARGEVTPRRMTGIMVAIMPGIVYATYTACLQRKPYKYAKL